MSPVDPPWFRHGVAMARHILMISEGAGVVNDHGLAIARNLRGEPQTCGVRSAINP